MKVDITFQTASGAQYSLSPEDARDLYGELHRLFGQKGAPHTWYSPLTGGVQSSWYSPHKPFVGAGGGGGAPGSPAAGGGGR